MDVPITIATIIVLAHGGNGKSYVDQTENFVFFGKGTRAERTSVLDCFMEMLEASCEDDDLDLDDIANNLDLNQMAEVEYAVGNISLRWEQR